MKEKLTRNISLKILSVILATLLWLVITNVDDPVISDKITNVPVEILNEDILITLGQVPDVIQGETVTFTVSARRSIVEQLRNEDFKATADYAELSDVGAVPIRIVSTRFGDQVAIRQDVHTLRVSLEELVEKEFKVKIVTKGEVAEGNYIGRMSASPNIIHVTGPRGRVERIEEVVVEVDVQDAANSFHRVARPIALDGEGNEIISNNITFSSNNVSVNIEILETKRINIHLATTGEPAFGYVMTRQDYEPKTILIAGTQEALRNITYLPITENITGANENIEKAIDLQELLNKDGVILVDEDKTAVIRIIIEEMETREISFFPRDIEPRNKPDHLNLSFNTTGSIVMRVMGPSDDMVGFNRFVLKPYIDLTDLTVGTYTLDIRGEHGESIVILNSPKVNISLTD